MAGAMAPLAQLGVLGDQVNMPVGNVVAAGLDYRPRLPDILAERFFRVDLLNPIGLEIQVFCARYHGSPLSSQSVRAISETCCSANRVSTR